jgi:hypothetical protein
MKTRLRTLFGVSAICALGGAVLWIIVFRHTQQPVSEGPQPEKQKTTTELLIGSWKEVQPEQMPNEPVLFEIVHRFRADGTYELDVWDMLRGPKVLSGKYQVQGNALQFLLDITENPSSTRDEICERTHTIESLTEEQLVIVTVSKKRWTSEMARDLAEARGVPIDSVLAEIREDRSRCVYVRIKGE